MIKNTLIGLTVFTLCLAIVACSLSAPGTLVLTSLLLTCVAGSVAVQLD